MKKHLSWVIFGSIVIAILFWRVVDSRGELGTDLLFGWVEFIARVLPKLHVRWDGIAIFAIAIVAATALAHFFMRWLTREFQQDAVAMRRHWRFRWTVLLTGLIVLMFVAGMSMIGATHQVAWLLRSDEPVLGRDVELPYVTSSATQVRFISMGLANESDVFNTLPTPARMRPGEVRHSWVTYTLPFLIYTADIDLTRPWDDPVNAKHFKSFVPAVLNPEFRTAPIRNEAGYALNHYAGNSRILDSPKRLTAGGIKDSAHTLLIGEVNSRFVPWGQPENSRDPANGLNTPDGFGGADRRGVNFAMVDGSVRFIEKDIDPRVLEQLAGPKH